MNGVVTIFVFDQVNLATGTTPDGVARLAVSFVADTETLADAQTLYSDKAEQIRAATQIATISVRDYVDSRAQNAAVTKYVFTKEGRLFYTVDQTYGGYEGRLKKEIQHDPIAGFAIERHFTYNHSEEFVTYDDFNQAFFVPSEVREYVRTFGDYRLKSVASAESVDFDSGVIIQKIKNYNAIRKISSEVTREVNILGGTTIREEDNLSRTDYTYTDAFNELIGIAGHVERYDLNDELLEEHRRANIPPI